MLACWVLCLLGGFLQHNAPLCNYAVSFKSFPLTSLSTPKPK